MDYNIILNDIIAYRNWLVWREDHEGDMAQVQRGKKYLKTYKAPSERCDVTLANTVEERMKRENNAWLASCQTFGGHEHATEQSFVYILLPRTEKNDREATNA